VHQLSCVHVERVCACSPRVPVFYAWRCGRRLCSRLYQETDQIWSGCVPSVSLTKFLLLRRPLVFPIPATACTAVRDSMPPKPYPLRSCTRRRAIRFLGSVSARLLASRRSASSSSGSAISTHHHGRQPWWSCCCGSGLPGRPVRASDLILPLSQNVRRLRTSQKSMFSKFDQVYRQKYEQLPY
jgi:hypothetical protein